uniref:Ubiquitin-like-conjugating enzyme ATG3 n=1 Tax=Panagrolaimus sp. JU765 TaxID=591449 RepID=A0AC34Q2N9_9BILA
MDNLVNSFKSKALSIGEYLTPVLRETKFKETGVLTPEEFVIAGDFLVHHCPTWSWSKAVDDAHTRNYLPVDKQYLITKHVPCHRRCRHMHYDAALEKIIGGESGEAGEEWVDTHHFAPEINQKATDVEEAFATEPKLEVSANKDDEDDDDDAPPVDMDAFMESGGIDEDDPYRFVPTKKETKPVGSGDNIVKTRTYDLHITYDKYYQVPRLWLLGYDEDRKYLTVEQMNEDFSEDHANKTITIEAHPHLNNVQMASIHPCRHAEVMKKLIEQLGSNGKELGVHQYLLIFLKFVQAVIPTIEYDYTRSIEL